MAFPRSRFFRPAWPGAIRFPGCGLFLAALLFLAGSPGPAQPALTQPIALKVGFSRTTFLDLNPKDLEASFKVLVQTLGRKRAYQLEVETRIFENSGDFEAALKKDEIHVAIMGAWEYSGMDIRAAIEPKFVCMHNDQSLTESLLLTRRDGGLDSLAALKGKEVILLESSVSLLTVPWVDVLLADARLGPAKTFFSRVEMVQKPTAAMLPVFFGKRQACAVDRRDYETLTEMNPQLRSALQVIAASPPFLNIIVCLSRSTWASGKVKSDMTEALRDLHLEPEGRQILLLFKADQLTPYRESQMLAVRELRARYQRPARKP